jgi:hypothetical protein
MIADDPRGDAVAEGPARDPPSARRAAGREDLEDLEIADGVRDVRVPDLIPRLSVGVDGEERPVTDRPFVPALMALFNARTRRN